MESYDKSELDLLLEYFLTNSIDKIKEYLQLNAVDTDTLNSLLVSACQKRRIEIVKLLLNYNIDINCYAALPLQFAIQSGNIDLIKLLRSNGADISLIPRKESTMIAADCSGNILEYLLESGLKVNSDMWEYVIRVDNLENLKILNSKSEFNFSLKTIWQLACLYCSVGIIEYILDQNIEVNFYHLDLDHIIEDNRINLFKKIINRTPDPHIIINIRHLNTACKNNCYEMARIILDFGLDPNEEVFDPTINKKYLLRPLDYALEADVPSLAMIKLLLDYGAEPTFYSLTGAYGSDNEEIFQLVYHSGTWTKSELSWSVFEAISIGISEKIWKFLHGELAEDLEESYLRRIISHALADRKFDIFEYFVDFYGWNRIKKFINRKAYVDQTSEYLEKFYSNDLD